MACNYRSVLWVVPKWPFPTRDGARIATRTLIKNLVASELQLTNERWRYTLLAFVEETEGIDLQEAYEVLGVDQILIIRKPPNKTGLGRFCSLFYSLLCNTFLPITAHKFAARSVAKEVNRILSDSTSSDKEGWDILVYDGMHTAAHSSRFGIYQKPNTYTKIVYRAHNIESDIWQRAAQRSDSFMLRLALSMQHRLVRRFEDSLIQASDLLATVSREDLNGFERRLPVKRGVSIPIGMEFPEKILPTSRARIQLLYVGRLDWPPNRDGLFWFLSKVWPRVMQSRSDIDLVIVGSGAGEWLAPFADSKRTLYLGEVDDLSVIYRDSALLLAPVFYGSGTRVKILDAARHSVGSLTTKVGIEGIGLKNGESYLEAESASEWIEILKAIEATQLQEIGDRAYSLIKTRFDPIKSARSFRDAVGGIL